VKRVIVFNLVICNVLHKPHGFHAQNKNHFLQKEIRKQINIISTPKLKNSYQEQEKKNSDLFILTMQGYTCCLPTKS
jgi:hypothetical protein